VSEPVHVGGLRAPTPDGVELVADAWLPAAEGRWPVLLQRLPYGRAVASTPVLPHPAWFARHGYAVVVVDARGRGDSGGTFSPFVDEADDGAATVEWAARLPFADGAVATYGFSYQGLNQLYTAARQPPSLRAIAPMMCCPDPYEGWTYEHGLLRWPFVCFWAAQLAGQDLGTEPIPYDVTAWPREAALGPEPPPWFREWLAHAESGDPYWQRRRPDVGAIAVPVFSVLGWFDDFSSGTADLVRALAPGTDVELWCGPWGHMPWGDVSPAPVHAALLRFFDRTLRGAGERPALPVAYRPVGGGWRRTDRWPPSSGRVLRWRGTSAGNANSRFGDGRLEPMAAVTDATHASEPAADRPASYLVVEPWVPYPGDPIVGQDEAPAEDRRDVLCFTSDPVAQPIVIAGSPVVRLRITADRPTHDVVATLVVVTGPPGGERAWSVTGSGLRWTAADPSARPAAVAHEVELRPVAWSVPAGARLRLDVSGARFPCYDRNPHGPADAPVVATLAVSAVELDLPIDPDGAVTDLFEEHP
jgi:putative CocE/NonD family hydrolase